MSAQEEFDKKYVTSRELCERLGVTRATLVNGRRRGDLPEQVQIDRPNGEPHVMFWLRAEAEPYVLRWEERLAAQRGASA